MVRREHVCVTWLAVLCGVVALASAWGAPPVNNRPIIGILTEPSDHAWGTKYMAASYVKWAEAAGARVVPIFHDSTMDEVDALFKQINGVIFPGGGSNLQGTPIFKTGQRLYENAKKANDAGDYFPIWGTCMGFELMAMIQSEDMGILASGLDSENITLALNFTDAAPTSRLYGGLDKRVYNILGTEPVTMNNHQSGVTPAAFAGNANLNTFFNVLSYNRDRKGVEFISSWEAKDYPFYGTQYHPEKNVYEWLAVEVMNHSTDAVLAAQSLGLFLGGEVRKSAHTFATPADAQKALIYNYSPVYVAKTYPLSSFEQSYFWN